VTALTLAIAEELIERIAKRAAEFLACPRSRIYALVSARRLPHHHDGSRLLFDRRELLVPGFKVFGCMAWKPSSRHTSKSLAKGRHPRHRLSPRSAPTISRHGHAAHDPL
jgi:excisionase family DNA binding protein